MASADLSISQVITQTENTHILKYSKFYKHSDSYNDRKKTLWQLDSKFLSKMYKLLFIFKESLETLTVTDKYNEDSLHCAVLMHLLPSAAIYLFIITYYFHTMYKETM